MARDLSKPTIVLCLLLAAATLAVYWPVHHCEFVDYDDPVYVVENPHITPGFTWAGIVWAFGSLTGEETYWHPVTWLSHMLDCQLFGPNPGPHHLVNLGFHIANAVLLLLLLRRMTQALWPSAAVAALFALHPWQVETVAWVAERKNVLSTFFLLLTLWAYARYAATESLKSKVQSLKSQGRSRGSGGKQPASAAGSQKAESALRRAVPGSAFDVRRSMFDVRPAADASCSYLPSSLFYLLSLAFFALGLMSKSMLVTLPFMLLLLDYWPLRRLTLSKLSSQGSILREKLPFLVLSGAAVWITLAGHQRFALSASAPPVPLAARLANALVSYGRYVERTFWPSELAVLYPFPDHWPVVLVLGAGLSVAGVSAAVLWQLRRRPYLAVGWFWFVGTLVPVIGLVQDGTQAMADRYMYVPLIGLLLALCWGVGEITLKLRRPGWAGAIAALAILGCAGMTRYELGFWKNSVALFRRAITVTPENYIAEEDLSVALARTGALKEARAHLAESLRIQPNNPKVHYNLALWLALDGQWAEAAASYREAIRLRPNYPKALNNLAWMLATHPDAQFRNGGEALQLAWRAVDLSGGTDPAVLDTLAAAYAETHQFAEAISVTERASALAQATGQNELTRQLQARLRGYRAEQPCRDPGLGALSHSPAEAK